MLVLDTRELERRPGTQRTVRRTLGAPAGLGTAVLGIPEGADLQLDVRLESVVEGVLVSGVARAMTAGECVRCLEPIERELEVDFQELFAYPDRVIEDDDARLETSWLEEGHVDLEPLVRDAVVLALPFQPVCRDDCPGLCARCGARLADDPEHWHEAEIDPRWSVLAQFRAGNDQPNGEKE